jgi:ribonuclease HI
MGKIYVVRRGRKTGIIDTWAECLEAVKGYPGASFKSFNNRVDAERWLNEDNIIVDLDDIGGEVICAYTDGSLNGATRKTAYGIWIPHIKYWETVDTSRCNTTNNYNELRAIYGALKQFEERNISGVVITDSEYSIMAIGEYVLEWERNGELDTRPNGVLIWDIRQLFKRTNSRLAHIRSHTGEGDIHSRGNAYVDEMVRRITER